MDANFLFASRPKKQTKMGKTMKKVIYILGILIGLTGAANALADFITHAHAELELLCNCALFIWLVLFSFLKLCDEIKLS